MELNVKPGKEKGSIAVDIAIDPHSVVAAMCEGIVNELIDILGNPEKDWGDRKVQAMLALSALFIYGVEFGKTKTFPKEAMDKYMARALEVEELHKQHTKELEVMKPANGQPLNTNKGD